MEAKLIGSGAEAYIYSIRLYGVSMVIKYRAAKRYRIKALDERLRKLRTRSEARIMANAASAGARVPAVFGVGENEIYMEAVQGILLKDTDISARDARMSGEQLAVLHNAGIAHGDFTPANLVRSPGGRICVIDFGLAEATSSSEERALDMLLMKRQLSPSLYSAFASGYSAAARSGKETMLRLAEVEERGRYQSRTLS